MSGRCEICLEPVPTAELISHIAVNHPDQYEPFETWPDGRVVVVDMAPEMDDFRPSGGDPDHG